MIACCRKPAAQPILFLAEQARIHFARLLIPACAAVLSFVSLGSLNAEEAPAFFRGLNLNGPPVTIDGNSWDGHDSSHYVCRDKAFENQNVPLVPPTDPERTKMIRSSRWGGNRVELTDIPPGDYTVFLYVWEDNNAETYAIEVNGRQVEARYNSGKGGHWDKLGPWHTESRDGKITLSSRGGAANFSGIELWKGKHDGHSAPISEEDLAFFEKRIRPLLVDKCYECHSAESKELQGDLLVDSRATLRRGGATGPAVVPGDVAKSLLIEAVRYDNADMQMPPDEKLSDAEIADLERWVKIGAPDPRATATKFIGKQIDVAAAREFWSFKPLASPPVPAVSDQAWPAGDIDRFVLAKLEQRGLRPAPPADKRALLRRTTYDLIGLPPTPEELQTFLADDSPQAFSRVVERLLDSPRYGERWGRHWLDVVRYADTAGDNSDYPIPQIYRYRDWVIEAFNRDLPYDEFVRDQLAGDLRGGATEEERQQRIVATGYLANSRRFGSRVDDYPQHLTIEDTIDNLGRSFVGLTLSCARCHDHKFDPISARDYYGLYGIFQSTRYPWPGIELDKRQRDFVPLIPAGQLEEVQRLLAEREKEQSRLNGEVKKINDALKSATGEEAERLKEQQKKAQSRLQVHRSLPILVETAYAVADAKTPGDAAVQLKGDPARPGDQVHRRFLTVMGEDALPDDCQTSGREQLAEWILADDNPLPARVMANRIWMHHFGRGIVPTPNDFGKQGKPPTHPELLDHLATTFRNNGWSTKAMHRLILSSKTYQQAAVRSPEAILQDPTNEWLAGFPRRRLDAESIRDTLLALGGNLDLSPAGPHPFEPAHSWNYTQHNPFKAVYDSRRRSVYLMTQRIQRHPYLAIFDGADPSTSTPARTTSTTPLQALFLLNDPLVHEQSRLLANRVIAHSSNEEDRIQFVFELLFARPATAEEVGSAKEFLKRAHDLFPDQSPASLLPRREDPEASSGPDRRKPGFSIPRETLKTHSEEARTSEAWQACIRSLFRLNEFVYLD